MSSDVNAAIAALQQEVENLRSRDEIRDLHVRYCRAIDRVDVDLLRSTFHDDAKIHQPPWFDGSTDGYVDLVTGSSESGFDGRWAHLVTTELIVIDGDRAESEWILFQIDRMRKPSGAEDFLMCARYLERLERRGGVWRVSERLIVHDIVRVDEVGRTWGEWWPAEGDAVFGQRSSDDASYQFELLAGINR